ncbi:sugar ABC transporter substrate-binding protein [Kibdelosporangium philippinense]|uniref:Sugar ABC transporter substrate-binding protein n=1 Tax=Kibdelosporangium philippinense TaxID=211113 RepID=A0ABS8ZB52_9PSEU|nr:sugar ABC transporter substrate-binding protein [Kibdelosporangium philippinense]MCE7003057.1 sugar ABC transporter substrate-binding protein [Kibdelosporangium philippinense]
MPHHLARRDVLKIALGTALLSACSAAPDNAATWSMWSNSATEAKVWEDFSAYVEKTMGVESIPTLTPASAYPTKLDLQLVSQTASIVTALNGWLIPTYAARGAHQPLDELIANDSSFHLDDFYPDIRAISSFDGRTYAIGFDVAPTVLFVNKTMFAQRGIPLPSPTVPMTWAQFRELALEFSSKPGQYGFTCAPMIDDLISWIYCAGGNVMTSDGSASLLDSPETKEVIDFVVGLFVRDKATPPIKNLVTENALANFLDGNVAFMHNGPWQAINARKAKFDWDIIPFPAGAAGSKPRVSGSGFAIPSSVQGRDRELAWTLLKTLTSTDALTIYAKAGRNNPSRFSAGSAFQPPPANLGIVQQILAGKLPGAGGHPYEVTSNWNEIRLLMQQELPRAFLGQRSVDETIAAITPRLEVFLTQHRENMRNAQKRKR